MKSRAGTPRNAAGPPAALAAAGSDSGGGAGIQADLLAFAACGVWGTAAVTCLTAQNPDGVSAVQAAEPDFVREQMAQVFRFFEVKAAKTGMLYNREIIEAVAEELEAHPGVPLVVDPVMASASGARLLLPEAVEALKKRLLPRAALVTPNLDETAILSGRKPESPEEIRQAAAKLAAEYQTAFLIKGGHLPGKVLCDALALPDGKLFAWARGRIENVDTHGGGCALSAAAAAALARGSRLPEAAETALAYVEQAMRRPVFVGGRQFLSHGIPVRR